MSPKNSLGHRKISHETEKSHPAELSQLQLFQARLDSQLNPDHPLFILADLIDWDRFDEAYAPVYCEDNGAPALPTRLMVGLELPCVFRAIEYAQQQPGSDHP